MPSLFTTTIKREVTLTAAVPGLDPITYILELGVGGLNIKIKGERKGNLAASSWREIIGLLLTFKGRGQDPNGPVRYVALTPESLEAQADHHASLAKVMKAQARKIRKTTRKD